MKKNQMGISEPKKTITEIEQVGDGLNSRMEDTKERISELEDGTDITQSE